MTATPHRSASPSAAESLGPCAAAAPSAVVAVPVKDEEARIASCLRALAGQTDVDFAELAVVLLLNNCRDATMEPCPRPGRRAAVPPRAARGRPARPPTPTPAGPAAWPWRRRRTSSRPDGLILTTDADTLVETDWVAANRREIAAGADAVAGYVMAHPAELTELSPEILERGSLEWEFQQLGAEMVARVDPGSARPLALPQPELRRLRRHHRRRPTAASAACRPGPVGEDRALFEMVRRVDGRIRHSLDVQVVTSARTDGRALGGLSDAIRLRGEPDHACDEMPGADRRHLPPRPLAAAAARPVDGRRRAGRLRLRLGRAAAGQPARPAPRLRPALLRRDAWARGRRRSVPRLQRQLVTGRGLRRELRRMRRMVEAVRSGRHGPRRRAGGGRSRRRSRPPDPGPILERLGLDPAVRVQGGALHAFRDEGHGDLAVRAHGDQAALPAQRRDLRPAPRASPPADRSPAQPQPAGPPAPPRRCG